MTTSIFGETTTLHTQVPLTLRPRRVYQNKGNLSSPKLGPYWGCSPSGLRGDYLFSDSLLPPRSKGHSTKVDPASSCLPETRGNVSVSPWHTRGVLQQCFIFDTNDKSGTFNGQKRRSCLRVQGQTARALANKTNTTAQTPTQFVRIPIAFIIQRLVSRYS